MSEWNMSGPKIENRLSLGNIINLLALIAAIAVGWGVMSERGDQTREQMNSVREILSKEVNARRDSQAALESRIRALESSQARADERFNSVLHVLGRIEARLERFENKD